MIESSTCLSIDKIKISGIVEESIVDGPGIRMTVFTQGCAHGCEGCHNPQTHDYNGGQYMSIDEILGLAKRNPMLDGITISGGEPFDQAEACAHLAQVAKAMGLNIVVYTGYTYEALIQMQSCKALLEQTDILIDGKFEIDKIDLKLQFRGSSNQRILYLKDAALCP